VDHEAIRTKGTLGNTGGVEHLELLANIAALEIRGDFRLLTLRQQALIAGLKCRVVTRELDEIRLALGNGVELRVKLGDLLAETSLLFGPLRQLSIDFLDLRLELSKTLLTNPLRRTDRLFDGPLSPWLGRDFGFEIANRALHRAHVRVVG